MHHLHAPGQRDLCHSMHMAKHGGNLAAGRVCPFLRQQTTMQQSAPLCRHAVAARSTPPQTSAVQAFQDDAAASGPAWLQRTELLVGSTGISRLSSSRVLLVGLGGVGSFAAEFLVRAGIGHLTIVDGDVVDATNKNRQLPALDSTMGQPKATVMAKRLKDINPELDLVVINDFLDPDKARSLIVGSEGSGSDAQPVSSQEKQAEAPRFDYVVDCIDSLAPKKMLVGTAVQAGIKVISSLGAGGRMDPSRVMVVDLSSTYNDPFATNLRRGLRKAGISGDITVVWSDEQAQRASLKLTDQRFKKSYYGTISYVPALFGLNIAAHIIRDLLGTARSMLVCVPPRVKKIRKVQNLRKQRRINSGELSGTRESSCEEEEAV